VGKITKQNTSLNRLMPFFGKHLVTEDCWGKGKKEKKGKKKGGEKKKKKGEGGGDHRGELKRREHTKDRKGFLLFINICGRGGKKKLEMSNHALSLRLLCLGQKK